MDGVAAVRAVLLARAEMVALVPAEKTFAGPMPLKMQGPALSLERVSWSSMPVLTPGVQRFVTERVQVTARALNYPSQAAILREVCSAADSQLYPEIPGISGVTIYSAGAGPDFFLDALSLWQGSHDFTVKYNQVR